MDKKEEAENKGTKQQMTTMWTKPSTQNEHG